MGAANKKQAKDKDTNERHVQISSEEKPKGTVQIAVEKFSDGDAITAFILRENQRGKLVPKAQISHPYAVFPLQPTDDDINQKVPLKKVQKEVSFTLTICFPKGFKQEIEAALWAWETFGGIGARTRRGFGALRCINIKEKKVKEEVVAINLPGGSEKEVKEWLDKSLKTHVSEGLWPQNIPHLSRKIGEDKSCKLIFRQGNYNRKADDLWYNLIEALKRFRQARYTSTKPNAKNPGRSMWPEPSTIRDSDYTNQSYLYHRKPIPDPPIKKFPRAAFGLPIIFQFKDSNKEKPPKPNDLESDPRKTVLELKEYERFASPLILKPLACQDNDTVGLAIILEGTSLNSQQLVLKTQEGKQDQWDAEAFFTSGETLELRDEKGKIIKLDSKTDVLQAFIKYL